MKKMILAVIPCEEAELVLDHLIEAGYSATFTESRGGMLRQSQLMLFIAVEADQVENVLDIIRDNCHKEVQVDAEQPQAGLSPQLAPVTAYLGGAVVFIWDLERMEKY